MRKALTRCLMMLPASAVALAACEKPVTTLTNEGRATAAVVTPRASANGSPLDR